MFFAVADTVWTALIFADTLLSNGQTIAVLIGAGGVISALFWMLIASKEREHSALLKEKERDIKELENLWKSFRDISTDAVQVTTARENSFRKREGLGPLSTIADVVPEAYSPSTELGRANAQIATLRAVLAQLKISAGQAPIETPEAGTEKR